MRCDSTPNLSRTKEGPSVEGHFLDSFSVIVVPVFTN